MRSSASSIKQTTTGSPIRDVPAEGTRLRHYFDIAMTGVWFDFAELPQPRRCGIRNALIESYELEFVTRRHPQATKPFMNQRQYKCTGRWNGADFLTLAEIETAIEFTQKTKQ